MKIQVKPKRLSASHEALIAASAISPEVARARGYSTAEWKIQLERIGFSRRQRRTPALVVPIHAVNGEVAFYQIRPDEPRLNKKGKPIKYETPSGARMVLDVPPTIRGQLGDPSVPLYVTEGVRKADSAVSHGLVCVGLLGVWNWRGRNGTDGVTALADWESIALNGRLVFVVFDSDVMTKREVQQALRRLLGFLKSRGARALPVYLKSGPNGEKVGLDDFFAAGGTVDHLQALATGNPKESEKKPEPRSTAPYRVSAGGYVLQKEQKDGLHEVPLSNFTALILKDIVEDDGVETSRQYEIEARTGDTPVTFRVPAAEFPLMNWVSKQLGPTAILSAGIAARDHVRAAIQRFSTEEGIGKERVLCHTGWTSHKGASIFLHAGGAIGRNGAVEDVRVRLEGLDGFVLPDPPAREQLRLDVAASLRILDLGPLRITLPVFAAIWRAVLAPTDVTLHIYGRTGAFKTELASLAQRHFGRDMTASHLPGTWLSTANSLEALAFLAKDVLLVIDDYLPAGSDGGRANREASRVIRAKGNSSGRGRMRADTTLRPAKPPRAFILSTGEDVPSGQSLRARMVIVEVAKGDIDATKLTACQESATAGAYERVMAAYVQWLASRRPQILEDLPRKTKALRDAIGKEDLHRRTPVAVADLLLALSYFLEFSQEVGALTPEAAQDYTTAWRATLVEVADRQSEHVAEYDIARRFVALLASALTSGRAHLTTAAGGQPEHSQNWGWRADELLARGERVGWLVNKTIYLNFEAALAVVKQLAKDSGEELPSTAGTIRQRLDEAGLISEKDGRGGGERREVRKVLGGVRRNVLAMLASTVVSKVEQTVDASTIPKTGHRPLRMKIRSRETKPETRS